MNMKDMIKIKEKLDRVTILKKIKTINYNKNTIN